MCLFKGAKVAKPSAPLPKPDAPEPRAKKVNRPLEIRKKESGSTGTDALRIRINKSVNIPK